MTLLTESFLVENKAPSHILPFVTRNNLLGIPIATLMVVEGDCEGFVNWLTHLPDVVLDGARGGFNFLGIDTFDKRGNVLTSVHPEITFTHTYTFNEDDILTEVYTNGKLTFKLNL